MTCDTTIKQAMDLCAAPFMIGIESCRDCDDVYGDYLEDSNVFAAVDVADIDWVPKRPSEVPSFSQLCGHACAAHA